MTGHGLRQALVILRLETSLEVSLRGQFRYSGRLGRRLGGRLGGLGHLQAGGKFLLKLGRTLGHLVLILLNAFGQPLIVFTAQFCF